MRQLGWQDNFFIVMETPRTPAHASYVSICDPATSPKDVVTFDDITEAFRRRLPLVPTFRRKLVRVPLGLDQAYWLEDADFDLEYHLRELALARPGNWKQLCTQVARHHRVRANQARGERGCHDDVTKAHWFRRQTPLSPRKGR